MPRTTCPFCRSANVYPVLPSPEPFEYRCKACGRHWFVTELQPASSDQVGDAKPPDRAA